MLVLTNIQTLKPNNHIGRRCIWSKSNTKVWCNTLVLRKECPGNMPKTRAV